VIHTEISEEELLNHPKNHFQTSINGNLLSDPNGTSNGNNECGQNGSTEQNHEIISVVPKDEFPVRAMLQDKVLAQNQALDICRNKCVELLINTQIEILATEFQFDRKKLTLYYKKHSDVSVCKLIRKLYNIFKMRIWMEPMESELPNDSFHQVTMKFLSLAQITLPSSATASTSSNTPSGGLLVQNTAPPSADGGSSPGTSSPVITVSASSSSSSLTDKINTALSNSSSFSEHSSSPYAPFLTHHKEVDYEVMVLPPGGGGGFGSGGVSKITHSPVANKSSTMKGGSPNFEAAPSSTRPQHQASGTAVPTGPSAFNLVRNHYYAQQPSSGPVALSTLTTPVASALPQPPHQYYRQVVDPYQYHVPAAHIAARSNGHHTQHQQHRHLSSSLNTGGGYGGYSSSSKLRNAPVGSLTFSSGPSSAVPHQNYDYDRHSVRDHYGGGGSHGGYVGQSHDYDSHHVSASSSYYNSSNSYTLSSGGHSSHHQHSAPIASAHSVTHRDRSSSYDYRQYGSGAGGSVNGEYAVEDGYYQHPPDRYYPSKNYNRGGGITSAPMALAPHLPLAPSLYHNADVASGGGGRKHAQSYQHHHGLFEEDGRTNSSSGDSIFDAYTPTSTTSGGGYGVGTLPLSPFPSYSLQN
jgi:hypothetical protein